MPTLSAIMAWSKRASLPRDIRLLVAGALISFLITDFYYLRSHNDMKADAMAQQRATELIFRSIESIGDVKYSRDASGGAVGLVIRLQGKATVQSNSTADLSINRS